MACILNTVAAIFSFIGSTHLVLDGPLLLVLSGCLVLLEDGSIVLSFLCFCVLVGWRRMVLPPSLLPRLQREREREIPLDTCQGEAMGELEKKDCSCRLLVWLLWEG